MVFSVVLAALLCITATAQGTFNAASCNRVDVNAVINGPTHTAVNGDTINVPGGSCVWTTGITVPSGIGISIIGAGSSSTTIIDAISGSELLVAHPTYGASTMRISGFTFQPQAGTSTGTPLGLYGTCAASGCPNIRVDNNVFTSGWSQAGLSAYSVLLASNVFGVIDHNTISGTSWSSVDALVNVSHAGYLGTGQTGDNSWASPPSFGTANALYLEDNNFGTGAFGTDCDHSDTVANTGGCRMVIRNNTWTDVSIAGIVQTHGTESTGRPRGANQVEVYGNKATCNSASGCSGMIGLRSGAALVYNNTFTYNSGGFGTNFVGLSVLRNYVNFSPWGTCDGSSPYDKNDGTVYASGTYTGTTGSTQFVDNTKNWTANQWSSPGSPYSLRNITQGWGGEIASNTATQITYVNNPEVNWSIHTQGTWTTGDSYQILRATVCIDQPGRGGPSTLLSGNTPSPAIWSGQALIPVYEWGDTKSGSGSLNGPPVASGSLRMIRNRDFYTENLSQAAQTSATSPFDGTTAIGMGHGTAANRPAACTTGVGYWATDQSTLYTCAATNTWSPYYKPYSYPHPIVSGTAPPPPVTPPPTGGTIAPPTNAVATSH